MFIFNGLMFILSVAVMVATAVIGLFVGNIIVFESIGIAIAAGCLAGHFYAIHPAYCLLIGIGVLVTLVFLMKTKVGFWLIGGAMSLVWGVIAAVVAYIGAGGDMVWTYVSFGLAVFVVFSLHYKAKGKTR
jgi:hypothetical protein